MDYRGYKVKETTAIGAFDVPRKMLVWGERGKGKNESPKVDTVSARVRLDAGVYALTTTGTFYEHCADDPSTLDMQRDLLDISWEEKHEKDMALMAPVLKSLEDPFDDRLDTPLTPEEP